MRLSDLDRLVTTSRVRAYCLMLVAGFVIGAIWWLGSMTNGIDPLGKPFGYDFITFYAAADLANQGHPAAAYDIPSIFAAEKAAVPANRSIFIWSYPPPGILLSAPLAWIPYAASLAVSLALTFAAYLLVVRRMSSHPLALLVATAFPAVFINGMHGQNGFLNVAILGFGLLMADRRPWLAGAVLGLMVYKPHFAVLLPFLLLMQGRWKTIAATALSALAICVITWLVYGLEPWIAFINNLPVVSHVLESGMLPWAKVPSIFIAIADLGAPLPIAYAVHGAVALGLAIATCWAWRQPGDQRLKIALAVPAILAVSPYSFDYDLMLLAIPIALVGDHALRHPVPVGTRALLVLAFASPIAFTWLAEQTHIHLMPVAILALYAGTWRVLASAEVETPSPRADGDLNAAAS